MFVVVVAAGHGARAARVGVRPAVQPEVLVRAAVRCRVAVRGGQGRLAQTERFRNQLCGCGYRSWCRLCGRGELRCEIACGVAGGGGLGGADGGGAAEEEAGPVELMLTEVGDKKVDVIKAVRAITGLGLKDAKGLVDGAPSSLKEGVDKAEAEEYVKQLEEAGAKAELK